MIFCVPPKIMKIIAYHENPFELGQITNSNDDDDDDDDDERGENH